MTSDWGTKHKMKFTCRGFLGASLYASDLSTFPLTSACADSRVSLDKQDDVLVLGAGLSVLNAAL